MKNGVHTISIFIILLQASISLSATDGNIKGNNSFQPVQPGKIFSSPDNYEVKETLEELLLKLNNPDPFVRVEAVQSLGEIRIQQSLESLCGCLKDENIYVRAYAAEAIGKIGRVDLSLALLSLLTSLDDPSPYVRAMKVSALGELQDERAVTLIRKLLDDEDESVRIMAAWALEQIENHKK